MLPASIVSITLLPIIRDSNVSAFLVKTPTDSLKPWSVSGVLRLVDSLPCLQLLSLIGRYLPMNFHQIDTTIPQLKSFKELSAPAEYITWLLASPDALRLLQHLTVVYQSAWGTPADLTRSILTKIVERLKKCDLPPTLCRDMPLPDASTMPLIKQVPGLFDVETAQSRIAIKPYR